MLKLLVLDIDGVIADSQWRFDEARAKGLDPDAPTRAGKNAYWNYVFDAGRVDADREIKHAFADFHGFKQDGWHIVALSSRLESQLYGVTSNWLEERGFALKGLHLKPDVAKLVKTAAWKASVVAALIDLMPVDLEVVFFVDDKEETRNQVGTIDASLTPLFVFKSLEEAASHKWKFAEIEVEVEVVETETEK